MPNAAPSARPRRSLLAVVAACGVGAVGAIAWWSAADAAPALGPVFSIAKPCVAQGTVVSTAGSGFAPNATVAVSRAFSRYHAPLSPDQQIATVTVRADASGRFTARVRAYRDSGTGNRSWQYAPVMLKAEGTGTDGHPVALTDLTVVASPKVCALLTHPPKPAPR